METQFRMDIEARLAEAQEMLEHSDDHDCSCSDDRCNCKKNVQQISHGNVIQVVFHGGPFRLHPKLPNRPPGRK